MIYFAHNKVRNAVKIGFSDNLEARFKALQTASLDPLELIGTIDGDRTAEKALHRRFKPFRIYREWFAISPELKEFIRDHVAKLMIRGIEIKSFYLAGKFEKPDWRSRLIEDWPGTFGSMNPEGNTDDWASKQSFLNVKRENGGREFQIQYTGPFCVRVNDESNEGRPHNYPTTTKKTNDGREYLSVDHSVVKNNCLSAISRADLIFAWIDSWDCFGTLTEIGYASAFQDKIVVVASPEFDRELWFACALADRFIVASSPARAWRLMWDSDENNFDFEVIDELIDEVAEEERQRLYREEFAREEDEFRNSSCDVA